MLQCCVRLSSVTYVLWLNGASYRKTERSRSWPQYAYCSISLRWLEIEARLQMTTNRKWHVANQMVMWLMMSCDPERSRLWPQYAYDQISWKQLRCYLASIQLLITIDSLLWGSTVAYSLASCYLVSWYFWELHNIFWIFHLLPILLE